MRSVLMLSLLILEALSVSALDLGYPLQDPLRAGLTPPPAVSPTLMEGNSLACSDWTPHPHLSLMDVVQQALCHNPQTRIAAMSVVSRAADVGAAKAAYLPTIAAVVQSADARQYDYYPKETAIDNSETSRYQDTSLTVSWLLYDFGARGADLDHARGLLLAAQADQNNAVLKVMQATVKDYYNALAGASAVNAAQEDEQRAKTSFEIAQERVHHGVAPISDQYQAETAYDQAILTLTQAQRDEEVYQGNLAVDMGLPPTTMLAIGELDGDQVQNQPLNSIHDYLELALRLHPQIQGAQAQLAAALAHAHQVRDQGRPSLHFSARDDRNDNPQSLGPGQAYLPARQRNVSFTLELDVPLFEGFVRTYQIRGADADVQTQKQRLLDAQQQVQQWVWQSFEDYRAGMENMTITAHLFNTAGMSYEAALQRYQNGAAGMIELVSAQTVLADARKKHIDALAQTLAARLELANSVGQLGMGLAP